MQLNRLSAFVLSLGGLGLGAFAFLQDAAGHVSIACVVAACVILLLAAGFIRLNRRKNRWFLFSASAVASLLFFVALALQFGEAGPLVVRAGLSALLLASLLLFMKCGYALNTPVRRGMHNYYDRH